jgi:hypothetical protein
VISILAKGAGGGDADGRARESYIFLALIGYYECVTP